MAIEVALLVAQVSVVVCPALTAVGFAMNCVICGGTFAATCTVAVWGALLPPGPEATAL
jgi:Flp pilus assembly pilin Flp